KKAQKSVEKAQKDYDKSVVATQNAREKYNASQERLSVRDMAKRADELKKRDMENKKKEEELKKKKAKKKEGELKNKYNHIKLPSGMIIKQQGPQWVLVDPRTNPSRTKDVTAEMNAFVRANKAIDEANLQIERNNKLNANGGALAGAGVEEGYKTSAQMTENTVAGMTTGQMKGVDNKAISTPAITDVDNKPLSEDDVKALARVSVERAFDENLFERLYGRKLKGPLEKGASALRSETDEERKRKEEEAARLAAQRRQNGGKE
ncbi:MAG: hypothetical protein J6W96_06870, partial [Alphaproteobacteria bacterium]|nr:hypothetical protein [Alphaproteobacteria bacterium]